MTDAVRGAMDLIRSGVANRHEPPDRGGDEPFVLHESRRRDDRLEEERPDVGYGEHRDASDNARRERSSDTSGHSAIRRDAQQSDRDGGRSRFQFRGDADGRGAQLTASLRKAAGDGSADRLVRGLERLVLQRGQARSNGEQSEEAQMSRPFWNQAQKRAPEMGSQDRERPDATTTARQFTAQTANREASNPRERAVTQQGSNQPLQASRETSEVTVEPMRREAEVQRTVTETLRMMEPERAQGTRHINDISSTLQAWKRAAVQAQGAKSAPEVARQETSGPDAMDLELTETLQDSEQLPTGAMETADGVEQPTTVLERVGQTGAPRVDSMTTNAPQPMQSSTPSATVTADLIGGDVAADATMEEFLQVRHANQLQVKASASDATIRVPTAEAGNLEVKLRRAGEDLQVKLKAEDAATRRVMMEAFPELRQEFNRANIVEGKVDVQEDMSSDLLANDDEYTEADGFRESDSDSGDERTGGHTSADSKAEVKGNASEHNARRHDGQLHLVA